MSKAAIHAEERQVRRVLNERRSALCWGIRKVSANFRGSERTSVGRNWLFEALKWGEKNGTSANPAQKYV